MNKLIKEPEEKLEIRLRTGLIAEKGLAFSVMKSGRERNVILDMSYKAFWIGDVIAWAIAQEYGLPNSEEERRELLSLRSHDTLKEAENYLAKLKENHLEAYKRDVPTLTEPISCQDVRKRTGKYYLSNREVYELFREFNKGGVERMTEPFLRKDGDTYDRYGEMDKICKIEFKETGSISNRTKEPEYEFWPIFDKAQAIDFFLSVRLGLFDHRPRSYYSMKEGTQMIVRAVGWSKRPSRLKLEELVAIAGLKWKNKTAQQEVIESYLREAKMRKYIKSWRKKVKRLGLGGRLDITYSIFKVEEWPVK